MLPWLVTPSPTLHSAVRETSFARLVRDEMLSLILSGQLAPGQRINEPDLAARMQVSRVPVREALRELQSSGLVAARKHAGVFVRVLEPKEVADLYELRALLDGHAGRRAARLGAAQRRTLVKVLNGLMRDMQRHAKGHQVQAYYGANLAFHWAIVEAADNQQMALQYRGVVQQLHLSRLKNLSQDIGMQASHAEHEQIVAALAAGDAERCCALQEQHVTAAHDRLLQLERHSPPGLETSR